MELNRNASSSSSPKNSNSSDSEQQDKPYNRPELKNVLSQTIALLSPSGNQYHPRTVYFINDPKLNENPKRENLKIEKVEITDKNFMVLYKAYKNLPLCLSDERLIHQILVAHIDVILQSIGNEAS